MYLLPVAWQPEVHIAPGILATQAMTTVCLHLQSDTLEAFFGKAVVTVVSQLQHTQLQQVLRTVLMARSAVGKGAIASATLLQVYTRLGKKFRPFKIWNLKSLRRPIAVA